MPRNNRPSRHKREEPGEDSLERMRAGWRRTETRRGVSWIVQPISESSATKEYSCPGCAVPIRAGVAHVVAWRDDGVMGDASDLAARRHWHNHCWKIGH